MSTKPNTESGIKPDIIRPDGSRLRSLPWGGRQYRGMGIRRWSGGFEVVNLHPGTLEPFPTTDTYRFATLDDACTWATYYTAKIVAWAYDQPEPTPPAIKPIEPPTPIPTPIKIPKRYNRSSMRIIVSR